MLKMISDLSRSNKPSPIIKLQAYVDTAIFCLQVRERDIRTNEKKRLREAYGAMPRLWQHRLFPITMLPVQCPQPDLLGVIDYMQERYEGVISRYDLAIDALPDPNMDATAQEEWLKLHTLVRGRRKGFILQDRGTSYFMPNAHMGKPRDLVMYSDGPSKLKPSGPNVAHADLRLRGRRAFGEPYRDRDMVGLFRQKTAPIETALDIIQSNPSDLIRRHLRFVDHDSAEFERWLFAKIAEDVTPIRRARRMIENFKAQWRDQQYQFDHVQRVHDAFPRKRLQTNDDLVEWPTELSWGAVRRSMQKALETDRRVVRKSMLYGV